MRGKWWAFDAITSILVDRLSTSLEAKKLRTQQASHFLSCRFSIFLGVGFVQTEWQWKVGACFTVHVDLILTSRRNYLPVHVENDPFLMSLEVGRCCRMNEDCCRCWYSSLLLVSSTSTTCSSCSVWYCWWSSLHRFGTARWWPLDSALADESLGSVQISFHGLQHCDDGVDFFLLFSDDDGQGLLLHVYFWLGCSLVLKERTVLRLRGTVGPHGTMA